MGEPTKSAPTYHDLHITTARMERTRLFNLPFRVSVRCSRVAGWQVWALATMGDAEELLGGEYDGPLGLRLDVGGLVIVDSLSAATPSHNEKD